LSSSGTATQAVGQAWLVVELHGGGAALSVVTGALYLPILLLGGAFGSLSDRFDRRRLLLTTQQTQLSIAALLTVLTATGHITIPALAGIALLMGTAFAADAPARQIYVFDLVGPARLASAVSLNEVVINASRILGPSLGGALLGVWGPWACFLMNSLSFVPTTLVLLRLKPTPKTETKPAAQRARRSRTSREGIRFAWSNPAIRASLLLAVAAGAVYNIAPVMPLMAQQVLHVGGSGYGAITAAFGVGALPGALLSATRGPNPKSTDVRNLGLVMGAAVLLCSFSSTLIALFVTIAGVGCFSIWFIARANAFVLVSTPAHLRGRVMGLWTTALPGTNTLTGLAVGTSAEAAGPQWAYGGVGVVTMLLTLLTWQAWSRAPTPGCRTNPP
jgi:MFS family permease